MRSSYPRFAPLLFVGVAALLAGCPAPTPQVIVPGSCQTNGDCATGKICVSGTCTAPVMAMCGAQMVCHVDADCDSLQCGDDGCCRSACTDSSSCTDEQECVNHVCRDVGAGCTSSAECPHESAPVCDSTIGVCVRCTENNQCPAGSLCENHGCSPSTAACTVDLDCTIPDLPRCDTTVQGGVCVACLSSGDCTTEGDSCVGNVCLHATTGCIWDGDCRQNAHGAHCSASGECVACNNNDDCPLGSACQADHTCTSSTACVADASCPPDKPHCRPTDHFCAECATNSQCASGRTCRNGNCLPPLNGCLSSNDCRAPLNVCDTTTRTCIGCRDNNDCGAFCQGGSCAGCSVDLDCQTAFLFEGRIYCDSSKDCVQCVGDAQCSGGKVCTEGSCVEDPTNKPCPTNGICGHSLQCVTDGTATGTCRAPCALYGGGTPCDTGLICGVLGSSGGAASGYCLPKTPGAAQIGGSCSTSHPCDRNAVCVPSSATASTCYALCDPFSSNPNCATPNACKGIVQLTQNNVPATLGACLPGGHMADACTTSAGCDSGQICIAKGDPVFPTKLRDTCWWAGGSGGGPGAGCSHDADCKSKMCLYGMPQGQDAPGFCQGGCGSDASCPARFDGYAGACEPFPAPWYDATGQAIFTEVVTCAQQCKNDNECPTGSTCDVVANGTGTGWASRCVPTNSSSAAKGGTICGADSQCFSNHCLKIGTARNGVCAGVCTTAADCASSSPCPAGGHVLTLPGPDGHLYTADDVQAAAPICWTRDCTLNVQCGANGVCAQDPAPGNPNDIVLNCHPSAGTKNGGDTCSADADCKTDFCVHWSTGARCFGVCDASAGNTGCSGGATCHTGNWPGTTHMLSYCAP